MVAILEKRKSFKEIQYLVPDRSIMPINQVIEANQKALGARPRAIIAVTFLYF